MATRPGRNDPCHCGSGKKYKRCCLDADAAATSLELAARLEQDDEDGDVDEASLLEDDYLDEPEPALPFARDEVLLVTYRRGFAESGDQIGSGQGFEVTEWAAPNIPPEILDAFQRESIWELDGWWGDPAAADPIQLDVIVIHTTSDSPVIEVQNRAALLAIGADVLELARITRVCCALANAAEQGTGRSFISDEWPEDDWVQDDPTGYEPDRDPDAAMWLALVDDERIDRVQAWHHHHHVPLPHPRLHAMLQATVETQVALGEAAVIETLSRLRGEGLTRHEAIHAVCRVLSDQLLIGAAGTDLAAEYRKRLRRLRAQDWPGSGDGV